METLLEDKKLERQKRKAEWKQVRQKWKQRKVDLTLEFDTGRAIQCAVRRAQKYISKSEIDQEDDVMSFRSQDTSEDEQDAIFQRLSQSQATLLPTPDEDLEDDTTDYWQKGYTLIPKDDGKLDYFAYHQKRKWKRRFQDRELQPLSGPTLPNRSHDFPLVHERPREDPQYSYFPIEAASRPRLYNFVTRHLNPSSAHRLLPLLWTITLPIRDGTEHGKCIHDFLTHSFHNRKQAARLLFQGIPKIEQETVIPWDPIDSGVSSTYDYAFVPASTPPIPFLPVDETGVRYWGQEDANQYVNHGHRIPHLVLKMTAALDALPEKLFREAIKLNQTRYHQYLERMSTDNKENPLAALGWTIEETMDHIFQTEELPRAMALVEELCDEALQHVGVAHFSSLGIRYELIRLARQLPDVQSASILAKADRNRPLESIRELLERLENGYLTDDRVLQSKSTIAAGKLEYFMFQVLEKVNASLDRSSDCIEHLGWRLALLSGCFLLCSGNRIDGCARRYPSFKSFSQHAAFFFDAESSSEVDFEVREKLTSFSRLRRSIAQTVQDILDHAAENRSPRAYSLIRDFLEWRQLVGLFFGVVEDSFYIQLRRVHGWCLAQLSRCSSVESDVKTAFSLREAHSQDDICTQLATLLENHPEDARHWRLFVSELPPLVRRSDTESCKCNECRTVPLGLSVNHSIRDRPWLRERAEWWPTYILNIPDYESDHGDDSDTFAAVEIALSIPTDAYDELSGTFSLDDSTNTTEESTSSPPSFDHLLDSSNFEKYDGVPTVEDRSRVVDELLPAPPVVETDDLQSTSTTTHSDFAQAEMLCYRLYISCYINGFDHRGTQYLAAMLVSVSWDDESIGWKDDAFYTLLSWLSDRGIIVANLVEAFRSQAKYSTEVQKCFADCMKEFGVSRTDKHKWKSYYERYPSCFAAFTTESMYIDLLDWMVANGKVEDDVDVKDKGTSFPPEVEECFKDCYLRHGKNLFLFKQDYPKVFAGWSQSTMEECASWLHDRGIIANSRYSPEIIEAATISAKELGRPTWLRQKYRTQLPALIRDWSSDRLRDLDRWLLDHGYYSNDPSLEDPDARSEEAQKAFVDCYRRFGMEWSKYRTEYPQYFGSFVRSGRFRSMLAWMQENNLITKDAEKFSSDVQKAWKDCVRRFGRPKTFKTYRKAYPYFFSDWTSHRFTNFEKWMRENNKYSENDESRSHSDTNSDPAFTQDPVVDDDGPLVDAPNVPELLTEEEEKAILEGVERFGQHKQRWSIIKREYHAILRFRSVQRIQDWYDRYVARGGNNSYVEKLRFTAEDKTNLKNAVLELGRTSWDEVRNMHGDRLGNKSDLQLDKVWKEMVQKGEVSDVELRRVSGQAFTSLEKQTLIEGFRKFGPRWTRILRAYKNELGHRNRKALSKAWKRMQESGEVPKELTGSTETDQYPETELDDKSVKSVGGRAGKNWTKQELDSLRAAIYEYGSDFILIQKMVDCFRERTPDAMATVWRKLRKGEFDHIDVNEEPPHEFTTEEINAFMEGLNRFGLNLQKILDECSKVFRRDRTVKMLQKLLEFLKRTDKLSSEAITAAKSRYEEQLIEQKENQKRAIIEGCKKFGRDWQRILDEYPEAFEGYTADRVKQRFEYFREKKALPESLLYKGKMFTEVEKQAVLAGLRKHGRRFKAIKEADRGALRNVSEKEIRNLFFRLLAKGEVSENPYEGPSADL